MKFLVLLLLLSGATFEDAVAAFEKGDSAEAEKILTSILQGYPNDAPAMGLLGAVFDSEKKFDRAESAYQRALRLTPHSPSLLDNFANHQLATGNAAAARATYLKVIAIDPSRANANLQLASMAVEKKQGVEALRYLQHVSSAEPQVQILKMQAEFLSGAASEANALLDGLFSQSAGDPRIAFSTGLALAAVSQYEAAEKFFSRALENAPGNIDVLYNLGLAASHAGDLLHALEYFAQAARVDSKRADAQLGIAQTTSALGYYADAGLAYQKYLRLAPDDAAAQREAEFMTALSLQPREGLASLQQISGAHPKDVDAHYEVGLLEAQSDPPDALAHLNKALSIKPDFAPARLGRGVVNLLQGNASAALPDLEFAASRYPDNSSVLDRLGEAYTALDRPADAIRVLRKASQLAPRDARVLMHLSRALTKAGRTEESRAALDRFKAVGSQSGNLIPQPGIVDLLALTASERQQKYRTEVQARLNKDPDNADLNLRYLEILIAEGRTDEISAEASKLLALKPLVTQAVEAGNALTAAGRQADAQPLLDYAALQH